MTRTSRIRKMLWSAVGALILVGAAAGITATPASASTCDPYCIGIVNTSVGPVSGLMNFSTAYPASTVLRVYRAGTQVTYRGDNAHTTYHYLDFYGLAPGRTYTYTLVANDAAGTHTKTGTFDTQSVRLTVNIAKVTVTDDSDSSGSGEMVAFARAGSTVKRFIYSDKSMSSGSSYYPNTTMVTTGQDAAWPVSFELQDEDCNMCTYGIGETWGSGSDSQRDWATASTWLWVPNGWATVGVTSFSMSVSGPVGFVVTGTYKIDYV